MTEPVPFAARLERGGRGVMHAVLAVPFALLMVLGWLGLLAGCALSVVGLTPALRAAAKPVRSIARADRRMANQLLDAKVPPPPSAFLSDESLRRGGAVFLRDRRFWRLGVHVLLRPFVAVATLAVVSAAVALCGWLVVLGVEAIAGVGEDEAAGPLDLNPATGVLLLALALPAGVVAVATLDTAQRALRAFVRTLLAPPTGATSSAPVREMLAASLGDRSLAIAYWLEDRQDYVDEAGRPVELPDPRSGRAWTAVERDGRRVAAIIHDAGIDAGPELVQAAAAAAALALDNERLKADLRARVEELRHSRLRIVEASDAARRRLERDLHDGAQQSLVSLALDLRLLKARLGDHEAAAQVDEVAAKLQAALAELRELARGIHPAILTQQGLGPAVEALCGRLAMEVEADIVPERLPPALEAAAYFTIAEALTNVQRYARASRVRVVVSRDDAAVRVVVEDDGAGGADPRSGTGLRGLQDRIGALDGTLEVVSPPGTGTRLVATLPVP